VTYAAKFIADSSLAARLGAVGTTKHPLCYVAQCGKDIKHGGEVWLNPPY
jgi:hypothetical protein